MKSGGNLLKISNLSNGYLLGIFILNRTKRGKDTLCSVLFGPTFFNSISIVLREKSAFEVAPWKAVWSPRIEPDLELSTNQYALSCFCHLVIFITDYMISLLYQTTSYLLTDSPWRTKHGESRRHDTTCKLLGDAEQREVLKLTETVFNSFLHQTAHDTWLVARAAEVGGRILFPIWLHVPVVYGSPSSRLHQWECSICLLVATSWSIHSISCSQRLSRSRTSSTPRNRFSLKSTETIHWTVSVMNGNMTTKWSITEWASIIPFHRINGAMSIRSRQNALVSLTEMQGIYDRISFANSKHLTINWQRVNGAVLRLRWISEM